MTPEYKYIRPYFLLFYLLIWSGTPVKLSPAIYVSTLLISMHNVIIVAITCNNLDTSILTLLYN